MGSNFLCPRVDKVFLFWIILLVAVSTFGGNVCGHEGDRIQGIRRPSPPTRSPVTANLPLSNTRPTQISVPVQHVTRVNRSQRQVVETRRVERGSEVEEGTLSLIRDGDSHIQLLPNHRDLVLVLGNTGAGKTTISKFLTNANDLESYWDNRGRFLIRDRENKIGTISTVISKTIFPELFIDPETGTAYYDLPGFSDTRNSSIELANAYFIKKIADHAQSVKLVFIVNYSSLRPGESRIDFLTLIRHAISLIPDTKKFEDGIVLIASKVESSMPFDRIISGIAGFLNQVIIDLPKVIQDEEELENAINLVSAMTKKSVDGNGFTRIGLFGFIDQEGPLHEIPRVQTAKELLQQIINDNTELVHKSIQDFRVPVSAETKLLSRSLIRLINERIQNSTAELHKLILSRYTHSPSNNENKSQSCNRFVDIRNDIEILKNETLALDSCNNTIEFLTLFNQTLQRLRIDARAGETLFKEYVRNLDNLLFFQTISHKSSDTESFKPHDWLSPLKFTQEFLTQESHKSIQYLNEDISNSTYAVGEEYSKSIQNKLKIHNANLSQLQIELQSDLDNFYSIKRLILVKCTSRPKAFGTETMKLMGNMSVTFPPGFLSSKLGEICKGMDEDTDSQAISETHESNSIFFTPMLWVAPFERFVPFLNQVINHLSIQISNEKHSQVIESQNKTIQTLDDRIQRLSNESLRNITALKKSQEESVQNYTQQINILNQNTKEMERNRTIQFNELAKQRETDQKKFEDQIKETGRMFEAKQEADRIEFERQRDLIKSNAAEQRERDREEFEERLNYLKDAMARKKQETVSDLESPRKCFYTECHLKFFFNPASRCPEDMDTVRVYDCWGFLGINEKCCH